MKVSTRLMGGFGLLVIVVLGVVAFNVSALVDLVDRGRHLSRVTASLHLGASEFQLRLQQMDEFARKYAATGDSAYARRFGDYADAFGSALQELAETAPEASEPVQAHLRRLEALWADFQPVAREFSQRATADPADVASAAAPVVGWVETLRAQALRTSETLRRSIRASVSASAEQARRTERLSWMAAGLSVLVAVAIGTGLVRSIGGGLGRLAEGTRQVAEGDLDHRLSTAGPAEFSQVAGSFNEMTRRLQEADRMKRAFFAHVSHDMKTPVSAMLDAHDLLLDEVPGPLEEDQARLLRLSRESGVRLREMIDQLLELARLDAGTGELEPEEVDVAAIVRRAVREQEPRRERAGVECSVEVPEGAVPAVVDGSYVTRVLENLLANAVEHSREGERIRVGLRVLSSPPEAASLPPEQTDGSRGDGWLEITVDDQGPGVPQDRRESIFEPFVREDELGGSSDGLGLGLALCRKVAGAHGGAVWVEDGEGGGSRFRVVLPRRPGDGDGRPEDGAGAPGEGLG